jgi:Peptidase M76 family
MSMRRRIGPIIRFMRQNIDQLNGDLNSTNIVCKRCDPRDIQHGPTRRGGGFNPDHGILICANEVRNQGHLEDTLAHEMVHAYDHLRFKVDWGDLRHAACSEVSVQCQGRAFGHYPVCKLEKTESLANIINLIDSSLKFIRRMQIYA